LILPPATSDATWQRLTALLRREFGAEFPDSHRERILANIRSRPAVVGLPSLDDYLEHVDLLASGDDIETLQEELAALASLVTTAESYFFRQRQQLDVLISDVLPEMHLRNTAANQNRPLTILSAGCSSGEEAWTIAILQTLFNLGDGVQKDSSTHPHAQTAPGIVITGVDLAENAIRRARLAKYVEASFRDTPEEIRQRFFVQGTQADASHLWSLRRELIPPVEFKIANLVGPRALMGLKKKWDVIVCRNVLFYLTSKARREVFSLFFRCLPRDGVLLLGVAEATWHVPDGFALETRHGCGFLRRT